MKIRLLLPLVALLASCSLFHTKLGEDRVKAEADKLLETDKAFAAQSAATGTADAFARFLDENATQLPAAGPPIEGRAAILAGLAAGPPTVLSWEPRYAEVFQPGDWGWTWGEWQLFESGAGGRRLAQGKYMNVWKREDDGSWKVRLDMGNAVH